MKRTQMIVEHSGRLAQAFVESGHLAGMPGVDDATLALGGDDVITDLSNNVAET